MCNTIWVINSSLYFYLISLQCNFSNPKKQLCQGRTHWCCVFSSDTTSTDHCERIYFWWVCTRALYLRSIHLPNWHFPFTYHFPSVSIPISQPLNCSPICTVDNFQRFQRQIDILDHHLRRRWSHFLFTYTLLSSGDLFWCRETEAHIPPLLVCFLPV